MAGPERNEAVDVARAVGVLGIFLIHVTAFYVPDQPLATFANTLVRWAVPMLFMVSGYLWWARAEQTSDVVGYARRRAVRLLPPYLFWTAAGVLYGAAVTSTLSLAGAPGLIFDYVAALLRGNGMSHLWFFPVLWLVSVIAQGLLVYATLRVLRITAVVLFLVALATSTTVSLANLADTYVVGLSVQQLAYRSPTLWLLAFVAGAWLHERSAASRRLPPWATPAVCVTLGVALLLLDGAILQWAPAIPRGAIELAGGYLAAFGLLQLVLRVERAPAGASWLGRRALGFYAVHPFVMAILVAAIPLISPPESGFTLLLLTSLAGSLAYVVAADRVRVLRFTVR